ncbi:MAG: FapA family protein, partial [Candidatus Gracilibacteria bacterium]|nr:FapA family protein [Candidatus Gracilibacteria bacterium]
MKIYDKIQEKLIILFFSYLLFMGFLEFIGVGGGEEKTLVVPGREKTLNPGNTISPVIASLATNVLSTSYKCIVDLGQDGVYLDLEKLESREDFINDIEAIIAGGKYLAGLSADLPELEKSKFGTFNTYYDIFQEIIFDFEGFKRRYFEMQEDKPDSQKTSKVRLCSSIKKFDEERKRMYRGHSLNIGNAEYTFNKEYIGEKEYDLDEFISAMWGNGIRFGIQISSIKDLLAKKDDYKKGKTIVVAKPKESIKGEPAKIMPFQEIVIRRQQYIGSDGKADPRRQELAFPIVERQGAVLYTKINPVDQVDGMDIYGKILKSQDSEDINLQTLCGEGVEIKELEGGIQAIVST